MNYQLKQGEIDYLQEVRNHEFRSGLDPENYSYELIEGRGRYNKIVATALFGDSRRAVAFIDKQTSHMFKAASWSQPARTRIA